MKWFIQKRIKWLEFKIAGQAIRKSFYESPIIISEIPPKGKIRAEFLINKYDKKIALLKKKYELLGSDAE